MINKVDITLDRSSLLHPSQNNHFLRQNMKKVKNPKL